MAQREAQTSGQFLDSVRLRHLARVVESSDDAIISKDLDGIVTSWNRAAERMFGYTAEEVIGRSIRLIIPNDRQAEEDMVLAHVRAGEAITHFETVRLRKDGTLVPISLTVSPIHADDGHVVGASKIARNITERARLLAAAREHATNTERLGEVGGIVASTLNRESIMQRVTDIATELTHAEFGAFFYKAVSSGSGEPPVQPTLSGTHREAFADFSHPYATAEFAQAFDGSGTVRLDDVSVDPRYGKSAQSGGGRADDFVVRSYLAVPVKGIAGHVHGGLFFGHSQARAAHQSGESRWHSRVGGR